MSQSHRNLNLPGLYSFASSWAPAWLGPHRGPTIFALFSIKFEFSSSSIIEFCRISFAVHTGANKLAAMMVVYHLLATRVAMATETRLLLWVVKRLWESMLLINL